VAIIDEIQMMRDTGRGWAWTRALLGVMAEEIHLCGEEGTVELVQSLMSTTGEDVEVFFFFCNMLGNSRSNLCYF
jgi:ATP-dependent RNA helicase SUPV3L1/SUV3